MPHSVRIVSKTFIVIVAEEANKGIKTVSFRSRAGSTRSRISGRASLRPTEGIRFLLLLRHREHVSRLLPAACVSPAITIVSVLFALLTRAAPRYEPGALLLLFSSCARTWSWFQVRINLTRRNNAAINYTRHALCNFINENENSLGARNASQLAQNIIFEVHL